jgi:hypothetical protein
VRPAMWIGLAAMAASSLGAQSATVDSARVVLDRDTVRIGDTVTIRFRAGKAGANLFGSKEVSNYWGVLIPGGSTQGLPVKLLTEASLSAKVVALDSGTAIIGTRFRQYMLQDTLTILPPLPLGRVVARVYRFDSAGSGSVLVSNGIPFPPGMCAADCPSRLRVSVGGVEQRIHTLALAGRHPDGTLRSVRVQFEYAIPRDTGAPASITLHVSARPAMLSRAGEATSPLPLAALLPTEPEYLVASKLGGDLTPATTRTATTLVDSIANDYPRIEAIDWKCGPIWTCGRNAQYERGYILYQQWLRTGEPRYWHHATAVVAQYLAAYVKPNNGAILFWQANPFSIATHYHLTGDEDSRYQSRYVAQAMWWYIRLGGLVKNEGEDRARAQAILAAVAARRVDASDTLPGQIRLAHSWLLVNSKNLDTVVTAIERAQAPNGAFPAAAHLLNAGGQKPYQVGMMLTGLMHMYEEVSPDPRIREIIRKSLDNMLESEWRADALGFAYVTREYRDSTGKIIEGDAPQALLNGFLAPIYTWYATRFPDDPRSPVYRQRIDEMLRGLWSTRWWYGSTAGKAFDEAYYRMFNLIAWRNMQ